MAENYFMDLRSTVQRFVKLFGVLENHVTPCGFPLSVSQVYAMQELEKENMSITELALRLDLERSSVSRLVDDLVKGEFVSRETNAANRREVVLHLTEKGKKSIQQVKKQSILFFQNVLSDYTEEDKTIILEGFRKFSEALSRQRGGKHDK
ncbi:MarR family winged helix-turn-helix transcriptional regulator [Cohnella caldifontis]|uniref:MarR family winged helix-turn-helix transcriptional regulator n=1 Tax=Cohnella caldifontis TaxID=3027471 RepID=UPI0023EDE132|nr:MarR family transcriptional regulator [Cohnella sp. YIM B05605]